MRSLQTDCGYCRGSVGHARLNGEQSREQFFALVLLRRTRHRALELSKVMARPVEEGCSSVVVW